LKHCDELKAGHPDAIILMRSNDFYHAYREDAAKVADICNLTKEHRVNPVTKEHYDMTSFPSPALDTCLPKLIRANCRVAICDAIEPPQQKAQQAESEERHTGRRM
jgi:DNA mismatch repair protein MutS